MPKYDLIAEEIKWCEEHRNPAEQVYQDGFIAGLRHALFLMKSRPTHAGNDMTRGAYRIFALLLMLAVSLACGISAPSNDTQLSFQGKAGIVAPTHTATATVTPVQPIATVQQITIIAVTELNIRECAGLACPKLYSVSAGTPLVAFCNGEWCYSADERGWFCYAAATGAGGCGE